MKKSIKYLTALLTVGILILACQEDEKTLEFPKVKTLPVSDITKNGGTFNAQIINDSDEEIIAYGFNWTKVIRGWSGKEWTEGTESFEFSGTPESNTISKEITTTRKARTIYYARGFIKTADYTIYGDYVEFVSF